MCIRDRIKIYCSSTQGQERLTSLALISIYKHCCMYIKAEPNLYDQVIEKLLEKLVEQKLFSNSIGKFTIKLLEN